MAEGVNQLVFRSQNDMLGFIPKKLGHCLANVYWAFIFAAAFGQIVLLNTYQERLREMAL